MELRIIDGQHFIVQQAGRKETIQTPAEAKQSEQREIEESRARIIQLASAIAEARRRLEFELIAGCDTSATHTELAALDDEVHGFQRDIDDAGKRIKQVDRLIDLHTADAIQQANAARLVALTSTYDKILKEIA